MNEQAPSNYPFEATTAELAEHIERFIDATFDNLSSFYLELPRGESFAEYQPFRGAYEELRAATNDFASLDTATVRATVERNALVLVVLRCMVGLSPPELADLATETQGLSVTQGFARAQDQKARTGAASFARVTDTTKKRITAMVQAACESLRKGAPQPKEGTEHLIHRLDKVDTAHGLASVHRAAVSGIEYPALLYERMLGRPFASHRDSVSEKVGDIVEDAIVSQLDRARVSYYKTGRAERVPGFDQAPDFLVPSASAPKVVIEAKLTQDDGTARDKVTRVQHLDRLSESGSKFQVVACIDGRGFRIRREDMKKLLLATRGKVFTMASMGQLVEKTDLKSFAAAG